MARKVVVKKERHSICFVAPTAFPLLANDPSLGYVGGAELQQTLIAREMVKRGHKVSMICMNHGQENNINVNGVTVYRAYKPDEGIPVLRFIYPRFTSIWRSMKEANADIYYQRSAGMLTGIVSAFCCKYGRESIYAAASNKDFVRNTPRIKYKRDRMLFEYGLKNVSRIVVQNTDQKSLLKRNYGRDSNIVGNGYALPVRKNVQNEGYILWVSTIKSVKQPQIYLELAKSLPQYSFKMIGGQGLGQERLYKQIEATATMIHNLEFLGFVPHVEVDAYFNDALLFINTSESEGFPNTFLQAWLSAVPTISFVECGAQLNNGNQVGISVESNEKMIEEIKKLMEYDDLRNKIGCEIKKYAKQNHSIECIASRLEEVFDNALPMNEIQ